MPLRQEGDAMSFGLYSIGFAIVIGGLTSGRTWRAFPGSMTRMAAVPSARRCRRRGRRRTTRCGPQGSNRDQPVARRS